MTFRSRKDCDGENVFDPKGQHPVCSRLAAELVGPQRRLGRISLGFRGPQDVESPGLEWTRLEAVVEKGNLRYYVNGKLVNAGTDASLTDDKIMIQSEGAEIFFRRIDLEPLK